MQNKIISLRKGRLGQLRAGHPWIYKGQFTQVAHFIQPGDIVSVVNSDGKSVGRGYYNPRSEISIRILSFKNEPIDRNFFCKKITEAVEKRKTLFSKTNAYRAIFSEADGLPGLIVDIYDDTAVFQILTLGMEKLKPLVLEAVREVLRPKYIYEKSESSFRRIEGLKDVRMWWGEKGEIRENKEEMGEEKGAIRENKGAVEIFEGKVKFLVDIENGHKTGFYLDQRKARMALEGLSKGKRVLDLFCYTGGFSISAAVYGAQSVRGIDIKEEWLELARKNAELNNVSERTEFVKGDAFSILEDIHKSGETFDIIILDPPSFLKSKESLASASKGYRQLNTLAMKTLSDGGILVTFSCSHNMPNEVFSDILKRSAAEAGKKTAILKRCHQSEDHPIVRTIPETEYLKGYFLRVTR